MKIDNNEMEMVATGGRLVSLDALRGFDMFWIIGGSELIRKLNTATGDTFLNGFVEQLKHVEWEGFHLIDLVMPLFLFMIGVAMPYSFGKRLARGDSKLKIWFHIIKRVIILLICGMMVNGNLLTYDISQFTISYSVLQVMALGYLMSSLIFLNCKIRRQVAITVGLLVLYWGLMTFVPVPGFGAGNYTPEGNFGAYVNNLLLGRLQTIWKVGWILNILTFGCTAMLGVFAGQILRSEKNENKKVFWLVGLGLGCLLAGWAWGFSFPIIKKSWTSTFVLYAGGWSYLLLAMFYYIIDVRGFKKWAFPFIVIGMNSIAVYMGVEVLKLYWIGGIFSGGLEKYTGNWYGFVEVLFGFIVIWLILYYMYRKKTFIKI